MRMSLVRENGSFPEAFTFHKRPLFSGLVGGERAASGLPLPVRNAPLSTVVESSMAALLDLGKVWDPRPTHIQGSVSYLLTFTFAVAVMFRLQQLHEAPTSMDSPVSPSH